ncbi:Rossmann fold nucleotide-binding protein Smf possibly involved in DNA uptake [hydrothermal vent metagenome]|uniref:Rossmann fold nucleotide-binding protein Smf possibly involved in DNA uptake n=1 Tax=hydrothermal vent metagenome TaxID=652676 RepID=A0A3B0ZTX7_9ZZZZ
MAEHLQTELASWLAVHRAPGVGATTFLKLLSVFEHPQKILKASHTELAACSLKKKSLEYLLAPDWQQVEKDCVWLEANQASVLTLADEAYPTLLKEIADPPPLLFLLGDKSLLLSEQIAMVGSRNPTPMGLQTAEDFAKSLAEVGWTMTSGLALGIDTACHQGALAAQNGRTIAVIGTGIDRVYPARNRDLAHQIAQKGVIISEFPLGSAPVPGNFPRRNRIISGMSRGVFVVEAALRSGSLITAKQALEQGREVFALPGSIHNPLSRGCHSLIRQGAKLVETAEHIYEELIEILPYRPQLKSADCENEAGNKESSVELDTDYQTVLTHVGFDPTAVDTVVERSGLTADAVCSMLLVLELQGYIASTHGGHYCKLSEPSGVNQI